MATASIAVSQGAGAAVNLLAQLGAEQIGEGHLTTGPGRYQAAATAAGLHQGRHLPKPHKFELAARKEEAIPGLQPADEGLLHMAQHRTALKAHRHGTIGGDRADVQAMHPGDAPLQHPIAEAAGGQLPLLTLQLAVTRVRRQTGAPVLQELQTPLPGGVLQVAVAPGLADRGQCLLRLEARPTGQGHQMLQQHIQRLLGWLTALHQPRRQTTPHRAHLQQFKGMGGHEQHLGRTTGAMGTASSPLQKPRQVLGGADLHHPLHGLEVNPQVEGACAYHPTQRSGLHPRLNRLALIAADGTVVQRQQLLHLRAGKAQTLMPAFRLVAGVREQQGGDGAIEASHEGFVLPQAQMARPGEAIDRLRQQAADGGGPWQIRSDQPWRCSCTHCHLGRLLQVAEGGTHRPGAQGGPLPPQPAQAQLGLHPTFAAQQLMPFIQDHPLQVLHEAVGCAARQQQAEGFGGGDQDLGRVAQLTAALRTAGVAVA